MRTLPLLIALLLPVAAIAAPGAAAPGFQLVKGLAGDWVPADTGSTLTASYRVTANGTTVIETLLPGTPDELVAVYTMEGDDLVLTHYCALGNLRLKVVQADPGQLVFDSGKPARSSHLHQMTLTVLGPDRLRVRRVTQHGGKNETLNADLRRTRTHRGREPVQRRLGPPRGPFF